MFDFLRKKAEIQLLVDSEKVSFWTNIVGHIVISSAEDFTSNSLQIRLNWKQDGVFSNDEPFVRTISGPTNFSSGNTVDLPFEIPFVTKDELESWYDENAAWIADEDQNHKAFFEEVSSWWTIEAHFDIPGFDATDRVEVEVVGEPN